MLPTAGLSATQVTDRLTRYINGRYLRRHIMDSDMPPYEFMRFVDWDHTNRVCRILLAGEEPNGRTSVCRNVIAVEYNDSVIAPIIKERFPYITKVNCLLTTDPDFDSICENLGARIDYPDNWSTPIPWLEAMSHYGDRNPNLESTMKNTVPTPANSQSIKLRDTPPMTTPQFFRLFSMVFHLNHFIRVMTKDNQLLMGREAIEEHKDRLPDGLEIVKISDNNDLGIICNSSSFFLDHNYKVVSFNA